MIARRVRALGALMAVVALLAACGSSGGENTERGSANAVDSAALKGLFSSGSYGQPPAEGPKASPGKRVWVLSCGQAYSSCSEPVAGAMKAAKLVGWKTTLVDGKLDVTVFAAALRQAIAAHADGIAVYGIDCGLIKQALAEARQAGIPVVATQSLDCDPPLFSSVVSYGAGPYPKFFEAFGTAQAKVLIAGTHGDAKAIELRSPPDAASFRYLEKGFDQTLASCSGCEIVDTVLLRPDATPDELQQDVRQALLKHPEANALHLPFDGLLEGGVMTALRTSGRADDVFVSLPEPTQGTVEALRSGSLNGIGIESAPLWATFQMMDNLNRAFAKQGPAPSGIGLRAYDSEHLSKPALGPPVDYEAAYRKLWGVR